MKSPGRTWRGLAPIALTIFIVPCRTVGSREVPARFPRQADEACRTEVTGFVATELKGHVVLVPETFTDSDRLLISRVMRRGPDGRPLDGRSLEVPEEFRLTRGGTGCAVAHVRTGHRVKLPACQCFEMPQR